MDYDVIIIGAGPGGYACAIRCGQLGLRTALVEAQHIGGVCLNWGCIPTKALVAATHLLHQASTAEDMGMSFGSPSVDLERLREWKTSVVSSLVSGIDKLLSGNGVTVHRARGRLVGSGKVSLSDGQTVSASRIVLATGSVPIQIPGFAFDDARVWSSDDALALVELPPRLCIIGGGVIGLEIATIYRRLGSEVTVVELLPEVLSTVDLDRRSLAVVKRALNDHGIDLRTGTKATSLTSDEGTTLVHTEPSGVVETDRVLLAIGRRPNIQDLGLEDAGIETDRVGRITVDCALQTTASGVYAIGDLIRGPMLAHKATEEGVALANSFAGTPLPDTDDAMIPQAIFTDPEIASVGLSEGTAKERGHDVVVGRFPFAALGKAVGMRETRGFFQIVADKGTHRILGAQIVGAAASDLISEAALAVRNGLTLEQIADTIHPHPTLPEGFREAAESALGRAIHALNRAG